MTYHSKNGLSQFICGTLCHQRFKNNEVLVSPREMCLRDRWKKCLKDNESIMPECREIAEQQLCNGVCTAVGKADPTECITERKSFS